MSLRRRLTLPRWRFRLLLDPDPIGGGGSSEVSFVTLTPEEYEALLARSQEASDDDGLETARLTDALLAANQDVEAARVEAGTSLETLRAIQAAELATERTARESAETRAQEAIDLALGSMADMAITDAMVTKTFVGPEQVAMVKTLLRGQIEAISDPATNTIRVVRKGTTVDAAAFLAAQLDSRAYAVFIAPKTVQPARRGRISEETRLLLAERIGLSLPGNRGGDFMGL